MADWKNYALWISYDIRNIAEAAKTCACSSWFAEVLEQMEVFKTLSVPNQQLLSEYMITKFKNAYDKLMNFKNALEANRARLTVKCVGIGNLKFEYDNSRTVGDFFIALKRSLFEEKVE